MCKKQKEKKGAPRVDARERDLLIGYLPMGRGSEGKGEVHVLK